MQKGRLNEAQRTIIAMNNWGQSAEKLYRHEQEVMNALGNNHSVHQLTISTSNQNLKNTL